MFKQLRERIGATQAAVPWGLGGALAAIVASFAAAIIGTTVALSMLGQMEAVMLVSWAFGASLTVIFVIFTRRQPEQAQALRLGSLHPSQLLSQDALLLLLIGVGLAVTMDIIAGRITGAFLPEPELIGVYSNFLYSGQALSLVTWLFAICFMVILQPLAEELVFRGLALPALRRTLGAWSGYLLSAVLYGVFHWVSYSTALEGFAGMWYGLLSPLIAGLVYGAVRLYTQSTRAALLVHAAFGLFALVKLLTLMG